MPTDELGPLQDTLTEQLTGYDWEGVEATVDAIAVRVERLAGPVDELVAKKLLARLREFRRFKEMLRLSEAIGKSSSM